MRGALPCWTEDRYLTVRPSHCSGVCLTAAAFELRERKLAAAEKAARLLSAIRWRCTMASAVCSGTTMAAASAFGSTGIGPPTVRLELTPTTRAGAPTPARLSPLHTDAHLCRCSNQPGWYQNISSVMQSPLLDTSLGDEALASWIDDNTMRCHKNLLDRRQTVHPRNSQLVRELSPFPPEGSPPRHREPLRRSCK